MSRTIEDRIVNMQFQNKQFEDAVAQSRQSIQLLEKDLKLLEGVQALKNIDVAVQSIDVSSIARGIETLNDRFSTLGIIGMTVTQNLTNAFTSNLLGAIHAVSSKVTGLFTTIYEKGLNRAKNIQQANFSLQGLLAAEGYTEAQIIQKRDAFSKVIDASVKGTAFGYDEAARAASTLAATMGTSDSAISRIGVTLQSISGVAGQTGAEFSSIADIFTKVAGNGRIMGQEIAQLSGYGLNAAVDILKEVNKDASLVAAINTGLSNKKNKRKKNQTLTEADIRDAASKSLISSDIFFNAMNKYFENAQKANDTLDGVTKNINAALGRLGASFIMPIIENEGPLVKFLQEVRQKAVDFLDALNAMHFQDNFLQPVIKGFELLTDALHDFKIPTEVKDFFSTIGTALSFNVPGWVKELNTNTAEMLDNLIKVNTVDNGQRTTSGSLTSSLNERLKTEIGHILSEEDVIENQMVYAEEILNGRKYNILNDVGKIVNVRAVRSEALRREVEEWLNTSTQTEYEEADIIRAAWINITGENPTDEMMTQLLDTSARNFAYRTSMYGVSIDTIQNEMDRIRNLHRDEIESYERNSLTRPLEELQEEAEALVSANQKIKDVYNFNYLDAIVNSFKNLADTFGTIKTIFWDTFVSQSNPFKEFFGGAFSGATLLRDTINKLTGGFEKLTEKIKDFFETERGINIIKGIAAAVAFVSNVIDATIKIVKNAFNSFSPLFDRIIDALSALGLFMTDANEMGEEMDTWTHIVNTISTVIDWIAKAFIWAWDTGSKFLSIFASSNIDSTIRKFIEICQAIGEYVGTNFPIWFEKAKPYLEWFGEKVVEVGGWLRDNLGGAFSFISPYIDQFVGWLSEATDGAVDLKQPIQQVTDILEDNAETFETVGGVIENVSGSIETVATAIESTANALGGSTDGSLSKTPKKMENIGKGLSAIAEPAEKIGTAIKDIRGENPEELIENTEKKLSPLQTMLMFIGGFFKKIFIYIQSIPDFIRKKADSSSGFFAELKAKFDEFKEWADNIDVDQVFTIIEKILGIFTGTSLKTGASYALTGIGSFFDQMPSTIQSITNAIKSYNPLVAEVAKSDNITTRLDKVGEIIKSIALVLIAVGASLVLMSLAMFIISQIPVERFEDSKTILLELFGILSGLVVAIISIASVAQVKSRVQAQSNLNILSISKGGLSGTLGAIAAIILLIGVSILLIVASLKIITSINETALDRGMSILQEIIGYLAGLLSLIGLIAIVLQGRSTGSSRLFRSSSTSTGDWKTLVAIAAIIFVIGNAISTIMVSLALIANLPMNHLDKAMQVFSVVVLGMIAIIGVLGLIAIALHKAEGGIAIKEGKSGVWLTLIGMAAVILVISWAIEGIMAAIAIIAHLPMNNLNNAIYVFLEVVYGIIAIVVVIGLILLVISNSQSKIMTNKNGGARVVGILLSLSVLLFVIGNVIEDLMGAIAKIAILSALVGTDAIEKATDTFVKIGAIIALIILVAGIVAVFAGESTDGGMMIAALGMIALIIAAIALLAYVLGGMVTAMAQAGDLTQIIDFLKLFGIFVIAVIAIGAIIGAISLIKGVGDAILIGIAVIALVLACIGMLAEGLGHMVLNIGTGVDLFADALIKLIDLFSNLDDKKIDTIIRNVSRFFSEIGAIVFAGLIGIATFIKANREKVLDSLVTIIKFILDAISTAFIGSFASMLDTLGQCIAMIDAWLEEHQDQITGIISKLIQIFWTVFGTATHEFMMWLGGEDGHGGFAGDLLTFISGFLNDLLYDENKGILPFIERGYYAITDFINKNAEPMANTFAETIITLINALSGAINEHGAEFVDAVNSLIGAVLNTIFYALGLPTDSNFETPSGTAGGEAPENYIKKFVEAMCPGFTMTKNFVTTITSFVRSIKNKIKEKIESMTSAIRSVGEFFARTFLGGLTGAQGLDEHSPSKKTAEIAEYAVEGFTNKVGESAKQATKSGILFAKSYLEGTNDALTAKKGKMSFLGSIKSALALAFVDIKDMFGDTFDQFVITPTMDLTQIQEGFGSIQGMMDGSSSFDVNALGDSDMLSSLAENATDSEEATETASGFDAINLPDDFDINNLNPDSMTPETIVNFTQNNYSPESLSRIDIYRDTKNALNNPTVASIFNR